MSSSLFRCDTHVVTGQHIRGYPRTLAGKQENVVYLQVKQYTPLNNLSPRPGDLTILGAHSNAFPKELYEPLWDELLQYAQKANLFRILSIWFADVASQGASGILNEGKIGNDRKYSHTTR